MKRFHVHVSVADLQANVRFYSSLFGAPPTVQKDDYAKWMMDDPAVNFAISTRGSRGGIDHLGIQAENAAELEAMKERARAADLGVRDDGVTTCCYARSDKHWTTDPQGLAWEQFQSLGEIPVYREETRSGAACCGPQQGTATSATKRASACC